MPVITLLSTSYNHYSGDDWGRGTFQTFSAELNFPRLAGKAQDTGVKAIDEHALGKISGMIRAEQSTDGRFYGRVGLYYNRLPGNGLSFTVGPEVAFNNKGETKFSIRTRVSFR